MNEICQNRVVFAGEVGSVPDPRSQRYRPAPIIDLMLARSALQSESLSNRQKLDRGGSLFVQAFNELSGEWSPMVRVRAEDLVCAMESHETDIHEEEATLLLLLDELGELVDECCTGPRRGMNVRIELPP